MGSGIKKRGFGSMSLEKKRLIASMRAHELKRLGKRHIFTHDEAVAAGKLGGSSYKKKILLEEINKKKNSE